MTAKFGLKPLKNATLRLLKIYCYTSLNTIEARLMTTIQANKKWWVLFTLCLLTTILNLDLTGVNLAVPQIAHDMQASLATMQWVINAYILASGMFTILGGNLGDRFGPR